MYRVVFSDESLWDPGGGEHWVLTTKLPWHDREGNITGLFGISRHDLNQEGEPNGNCKSSYIVSKTQRSMGFLF